MAERITVEVVLALPDAAWTVTLEVPRGTSLLGAVERSRLAELASGIEIGRCSYGIFGTRCVPGTLLSDGDRVEIYRPVTADAKALRRQRAAR